VEFLILVGTILGSITAILSICIWDRVTYAWLEKTAGSLILLLPFERIPSLEIGGGSIRLSQLVVLFGFYLLAILLIKKDPTLLKKKIHTTAWLILGFFVFSIPSWFMVLNFGRFVITYGATVLVFGALFLVSNFTRDLWFYFVRLLYVYTGVAFFAVYQFVGDMINLPLSLTGLQLLHSKIVFGFPRVHATFNEPAYFANGLFVPILAFLYLYISKINIFTKYKEATKPYQALSNVLHRQFVDVYFGLFVLFSGLFVATLAKSAFAVAPIVVILAAYYAIRHYTHERVYKVVKYSSITAVFLLIFSFLYVAPVRNTITGSVIPHFIATLQGESATAEERAGSFMTAINLAKDKAVTGHGSGQYGTVAQPLIKDFVFKESTEDVIVFNVFAEVWMEFGLISFSLFVAILIGGLYHTWKSMQIFAEHKQSRKVKNYVLLSTVLGLALVASILQWNFISPIYIMPIFILLGMAFNIPQQIDRKLV
jgi:O-antigen ligase